MTLRVMSIVKFHESHYVGVLNMYEGVAAGHIGMGLTLPKLHLPIY